MQIIYKIKGVYDVKGSRISNHSNKKIQLEPIDTNIDDKDIVDFCLNCTKPECKSGQCKELKKFLRERKNNV